MQLTAIHHIAIACSNYSLCEKLIDTVIEIQKDTSKFSVSDLAYSYRNKADLLLQFDRARGYCQYPGYAGSSERNGDLHGSDFLLSGE